MERPWWIIMGKWDPAVIWAGPMWRSVTCGGSDIVAVGVKKRNEVVCSKDKNVTSSRDDSPWCGPSSNECWVSLPHNHTPWPWKQSHYTVFFIFLCHVPYVIKVLWNLQGPFCVLTWCLFPISLGCVLSLFHLPRTFLAVCIHNV